MYIFFLKKYLFKYKIIPKLTKYDIFSGICHQSLLPTTHRVLARERRTSCLNQESNQLSTSSARHSCPISPNPVFFFQ